MEVTLDLGGVQTDVSRFEVSLYANATLGVLPPFTLTYMRPPTTTSPRSARVYAPMNDVEGCITYTLALPETVEARRVRFSFPEQERGSLMLEELSVYAYRDAAGDGFESFYREEPDSEGRERKALSLDGRRLQRTHQSDRRTRADHLFLLPAARRNGRQLARVESAANRRQARVDALLHGQRLLQVRQRRGARRSLRPRATATVDGFTLSFLRETPVGINSISSVLFYLSENGVDWYAVKAAVLPSEQDTEFLRYDYKLDETYKARFARFSFRVWPNAYCDELEVWGTKKVDGSSVPLSASGIEPASAGRRRLRRTGYRARRRKRHRAGAELFGGRRTRRQGGRRISACGNPSLRRLP